MKCTLLVISTFLCLGTLGTAPDVSAQNRPSISPNDDCTDSLSALTLKRDLKDRITKAYHSVPWSERIRYYLDAGKSFWRPYQIIELKELLPGGKMPPPAKPHEVYFARKSRDEGEKELRVAVDFPEERGWVFVPKHGLWIYSTTQASGTDNHPNGALHLAVWRAFGSVDLYHTHPNALVQSILGAPPEGTFAIDVKTHLLQLGISERAFAIGTVGLPSENDIDSLNSYFSEFLNPTRELTGHIVHRHGITSYTVKPRWEDSSNSPVQLPFYFKSAKRELGAIELGGPPIERLRRAVAAVNSYHEEFERSTYRAMNREVVGEPLPLVQLSVRGWEE
jgi:hypothetical protein